MTLTPGQRAEWAAAGRVVLRGAVHSEALAKLTSEVDEVESWAEAQQVGMHHFEMTDGGPQLARSEDFDPHHPSLSAFIRGGLISDVLAELFGEPAVLFKEKINYKHPGGAGFAPHQDITAYRNGDLAHVERHISVLVPLDPMTVESGCLFFTDEARDVVVSNIDGRIDPAWVAAASWQPVEALPGDLLFFDSFAPHYSGTNNANRSRRAMYLTYNRASEGDLRAAYYADKRGVLARSTAGAERVRISVNDDFLGRPV